MSWWVEKTAHDGGADEVSPEALEPLDALRDVRRR